jgi:hypothetical protein
MVTGCTDNGYAGSYKLTNAGKQFLPDKWFSFPEGLESGLNIPISLVAMFF